MTSTLFAALASAPNGESVHHVYQTDENTLIEKTFTNGQWSLPKVLGPAKAGTTAAACFPGPKGIIISLDETGILQDHVYDPDEEEWQDGSLSNLTIKAHSESKIAMTIHNGVVHLYYQSPSEEISETVCDPSFVWAPPKALSVPKPVAGAGICVASTDGGLCLSYVHQDGSLHRSKYQNDNWADTSLGNTSDGAPPVRILALLGTASICYSTKSGDLVGVDDSGTHQKLGDINKEGEVQTFGGKECFSISAGLSLPFGFGIGASINIGGGYRGGFNGGFGPGGYWAPTPGLDGYQSLMYALQYGMPRPQPRYMV